jgi:hypothetical protein
VTFLFSKDLLVLVLVIALVIVILEVEDKEEDDTTEVLPPRLLDLLVPKEVTEDVASLTDNDALDPYGPPFPSQS